MCIIYPSGSELECLPWHWDVVACTPGQILAAINCQSSCRLVRHYTLINEKKDWNGLFQDNVETQKNGLESVYLEPQEVTLKFNFHDWPCLNGNF